MSRTQRCIVCTQQLIEKPLWEDEVCSACGRCEEHCTAPHTLSFDVAAKTEDGRPHNDAGKRLVEERFKPAPEDPDRARAPV